MNRHIDELQTSAANDSPERSYSMNASTPTSSAQFLHHQQQQFLRYSGLRNVALSSQSLPQSARPLPGNGVSPLAEDPKALFCHPPTSLECAVKSEPTSEAAMTQSMSYDSHAESSRAADKLYPLVIAEYYMNPILFIDDNKEKVTAQCKRCGRPVTGWWSPRLVTSNFITHLKSCSVELYQHFLETKKRCGWTARRYTVKLRADTNAAAPWRTEPASKSFPAPGNDDGVTSYSDGRSPSDEGAILDATTDPGSEESRSAGSGRARLGYTNHLLRTLAAFAAEDLRPPGSVLGGAVERLLLRFGVRCELPSEERLRSYMIDHEGIIKKIAFDGLPPLDKCSILLGIHVSSNQDCLACIVCYWCCSIRGGRLHKRLFSVRRYGNLKTALEQVPDDLCNARRFQRGLSEHSASEVTSSQPTVVLSRQPSAYLRIPTFNQEGQSAFELSLPPAGRSALTQRLIEDVPQKIWSIFIAAIRSVEPLTRLLDLALGHMTSAVLGPASTLAEPGECSFFATQLRLLSRLSEEASTRYAGLFDLVEASLNLSAAQSHGCLAALLSMGQYFASAVQRLHGRGVTISNILPLLLGLQKKAGTAESASEPVLIVRLRQAVKGQLEAVLEGFSTSAGSEEPSIFLLATFADPQYKLFWVEDANQEKEYREKIIKFLSNRLPKPATSNIPAAPAEQPEVDDGLLDFVAKRRRLAISEAGCEWPLLDEVSNYLVNKDMAPALEFWASERRQGIFPNIFKLHREVHAVALSCFDASLDSGLSSELLCEALGPGRWSRESPDMLELLSLAKCYSYDFSGRPLPKTSMGASTIEAQANWPL